MESARAKNSNDMHDIRRRIFEVIEPREEENFANKAYSIFIIILVVLSIIPLMFKKNLMLFAVIDGICIFFFVVDYALRLATADFKLKDSSYKAFLRYPITPMAIIDLIAILPSFIPVSGSLKLLRLIRVAKILRILKLLRYSRSITILTHVLKRSSRALVVVGAIAVFYVLVTGLIAFNAEPELFNNYFEAMYWIIVIWNADPTTVTGHVLAVFSIIFGLSIIALPASIITAEYTQILNRAQHAADFKKELKHIEEEIDAEVEKNLNKHN